MSLDYLRSQPDAAMLMQMLGLLPYTPGKRSTKRARKPLDQVPHGARSTYSNHGCRCEPCTAAERAYRSQWKPNYYRSFKHGTRYAYDVRGCRCRSCTAAKLAYSQKDWNKRKQRAA